MRKPSSSTAAFLVLLLSAAHSQGDEGTDRDAAIRFFADSVGTECDQELIDQLGISKEQCDRRHMESVKRCKEVAATGLPALLSQKELGRAMLRFSLCRGVVIHGGEFELVTWDPTITRMLDEDDDKG